MKVKLNKFIFENIYWRLNEELSIIVKGTWTFRENFLMTAI